MPCDCNPVHNRPLPPLPIPATHRAYSLEREDRFPNILRPRCRCGCGSCELWICCSRWHLRCPTPQLRQVTVRISNVGLHSSPLHALFYSGKRCVGQPQRQSQGRLVPRQLAMPCVSPTHSFSLMYQTYICVHIYCQERSATRLALPGLPCLGRQTPTRTVPVVPSSP